jgi:hypothetical protein
MAYQIKRGDTLSGIAIRFKTTVSALMKANPQIRNANVISAGATLNMPGGRDDFKPTVNPPTAIAPVASGRAGEVPRISQYSPAGASHGYTNGNANCGPTSMAQIARAVGYGKGMQDAQLINHLGRIGGTGSNGTGVNGIVAMARAMGKTGVVKGPGPNIAWMKEQLAQGKLLVANGDYHAMPPHQNEARTSGHYVTVAGVDARGNFIVRDPADGRVNTISPDQMAHFIRSNPNGGWCISVG